MKIFKYQTRITDKCFVMMPVTAKILKIGSQEPNFLTVWALVDETEFPTQQYVFTIYGTGHPVEHTSADNYIDSIFDGQFVWHVFRGKE